MVNFNFGLGGLVGGNDDKKDDKSAKPIGDDSQQDDSATTVQTDEPVVVENTEPVIETKEENTVSEPVFEEEIKTTEAENPAPFTDEPQTENSEIMETATEVETPVEINSEETVSQSGEDESWLGNDNTPHKNTEINTSNEVVPTIGASEEEVKEPATVAEESNEILPEINSTETETEVPEEIAPAMKEENPFPEAATPIIDESIPVEDNEEKLPTENVAENSSIDEAIAEKEAAPSELVSSGEENTENANAGTLVPEMPKAESINTVPEIPTFGQPENNNSEETINTSNEELNEVNTEEVSSSVLPVSNPSDDFLSVKEEPTDNSNEELNTEEVSSSVLPASNPSDDFLSVKEESMDNLEENALNNEDPLAPSPIGTIGSSSPVSTFSEEEEKAEDPAEILEKFKSGASSFAKKHNQKIESYQKQIEEWEKKIKEEKDILKEEQAKSNKILKDLNELVAGFSSTNSIKKKSKKRQLRKKSN